MKIIILIFLPVYYALCFFDVRDIISESMKRLPKDFSVAVKDICEGLPSKTITIVRGNSTDIRLVLFVNLALFLLFLILSEVSTTYLFFHLHFSFNLHGK